MPHERATRLVYEIRQAPLLNDDKLSALPHVAEHAGHALAEADIDPEELHNLAIGECEVAVLLARFEAEEFTDLRPSFRIGEMWRETQHFAEGT